MKDIEDKIYNVNLFRISTANSTAQNSKSHSNNEFKVSDQCLQSMNSKEMFPSNTRLKPFNSNPNKAGCQVIWTITFGSNSVPVKWYIIASDCEPILVRTSALWE